MNQYTKIKIFVTIFPIDFYKKLREKYYPFDENDDKETQKIKQDKYD